MAFPERLPTTQKKVSRTVYLDRRQVEALESIREATKVPTAERIREGIDAILKAHADELQGEEP